MNKCVVKISVSSKTNYCLIDDVVYYRSGMSPDFVDRWLWFFEYLSARVKVANPKRKVEFYKGPQDVMLGNEWHEYRRNVMMRTCNTKLKKLEKGVVNDDLFHFASQDNDEKISEVRTKLTSLEKDEFPIPAFPEYINKIKRYI